MGDGFSFSMDGLDRAVEALGALNDQTQSRILGKMQKAADATLAGADANVPVDKGKLKESGHVAPGVEGDREHITFDVVYGGNGEATAKTYGYPPNGINGDMQADGYAWFVELGTVKAGAQPFLGPAFEEQSQILLDSLGDILS